MWYGTLVALVVVAFGALVLYLAWRSRVADVDAQLRTRAELLGYALEPTAGGTFDLRLPPVAGSSEGHYHAVWTDVGALIDRSDPDLDAQGPPAPGVRMRDGSRELVVHVASGAVVLVGRPLDAVRAEVRSLLW